MSSYLFANLNFCSVWLVQSMEQTFGQKQRLSTLQLGKLIAYSDCALVFSMYYMLRNKLESAFSFFKRST